MARAEPMTLSRKQSDGMRRALGFLLVTIGFLVTLDVWADIYRIAMRDEEASHILLVPIVAIFSPVTAACAACVAFSS